jgi:hypothetical protein
MVYFLLFTLILSNVVSNNAFYTPQTHAHHFYNEVTTPRRTIANSLPHITQSITQSTQPTQQQTQKTQQTTQQLPTHHKTILKCSKNTEFWDSQRTLLGTSSSLPPTPFELYKKRTTSLLLTTISLVLPTTSLLYLLLPSPTASLSFLLGGLLGILYCRGLTSYVSMIGGSAINSSGEVDLSAAGGGSARFAFLILMFVMARALPGKVELIEAIPGFFFYQIASVIEGQRQWEE